MHVPSAEAAVLHMDCPPALISATSALDSGPRCMSLSACSLSQPVILAMLLLFLVTEVYACL